MLKIPKIQTVSFFGTVAAGSNVTLISNKITSPFMVKRLRAAFPLGVNRLMTLRYLIVGTDYAPTDAVPAGTNLLGSIGQVDYLTGDDNIVQLDHQIVSPESNRFLAVYAENSDTFDHTIETQITIEFIDPEEVDPNNIGV